VRLPLRVLSTLLIAAGVASCSDTPPAAVKHSSLGPSGGAVGRVAFEPIFSAAALQVAQHLGEFGIQYDRARVSLIRPPGDTVRDTTVAFTPDGPDVTLSLTVEVRSNDEVFDVAIDYLSSRAVVFHGKGRVRSHAPDQPAIPQQQISVDYVGPGANVSRLDVSPKTSTIRSDQSTTLVAAAFDAAGNPVSVVPLSWTTSDPSIATISSTGVLQALGQRGIIVVTASTPNGVTDRATVVVVPPPSTITLISGGGQTGTVGTSLAAPATIQVNAADGVGVPGVSVVFAPPSSGQVGAASAVTDANGRASTSLTLGTTSGPQTFGVAAGNLSAVIPETAIAGSPVRIEAISGDSQTDTIRTTLPPLVVRVNDQFGNPVPGVVVTWTRNGNGSLGSETSTTAGDGRATTSYTLGSVAGNEAVTASVGGLTSHAVFAFHVAAGAPSAVAVVSGNAQAAIVGTALAAPLVVRVTDDAGNPVGGATIHWAAANGTIAAISSTSFEGRSSASLTLGTQAGPASATAAIVSGRRATFSATAQPGPFARLAFSTQPANATAGAAISAVRVALLDAHGNQTTAANSVTVAIGNNPSGSTLGGTLVRNAVNGVAAFGDLTIDNAGNAFTLVASSGGVAPTTSAPFNVAPAPTPKLTIVAGDGQLAAAGSAVAIAPSVKVTDNSGNPVAGASVTFSPANGATIIPSAAVVTDAAGIASLTSWTLGSHAGPQTLLVSSPGYTSVSIRATAFAGPPAMLAITTQPSSIALSGVAFDVQPAIQLLDHFGNSTATNNLTVTVSASGGTLQGTTSVVADPITGVATFTDLKIVGSGDVTLTFTAVGVQPATSTVITVSAGPTTTETVGARF
jgi:hypothetical protein